MRCFMCLLTATLLLFPMLLSAQSPAFDPYPVFDNGPMRMTVSMRGQMGHVAPNGPYGMFWPGKGVSDDKTRGLCFTSTPVLTGRVRGELRVSASYYRDNFVPGPIIGGKPAVDPTDPFFRAYTATWQMINEPDYIEWPTGIGAPTQANGEPYFYGPSQMFWVMNDLDTAAMRQHNGCDPMGVEMRCLLYAPWPGEAFDNSLYLQVTYINKGNDSIRDAYVGYFMDVDLRDALNDLPGSDSAHGMVYAYQGSLMPKEEGMPAAFGIAMLQTPTVPVAGDSARWFAGWKADARNMPVTAAVSPLKSSTGSGGAPIREPDLGSDAAERWLVLMQGRGSGVDVVDPLTGAPSRYWFSGDPARGNGWLPDDGLQYSDGQKFAMDSGDKRLLISAGPFDLAPGDTQQVTYAFIAARGATPVAAVYDLRDRAEFIRAHFLRRPQAAAYRSANVRIPTSESTPGQVEVNARMAGIPANLHVEISSADGAVLAGEALDRFSSQGEWVYRKTVTLPEAFRDGVNVSFVSEWEGEQVRIPGRVSLPVGGSIDLEGIEILEEGDGNGRISPEDDAKWFPRVVNRSSHDYGLFAQSYLLPSRQWLRVPDLQPGQTMPSAMQPWLPEYGYSTLWHDSLATVGDSVFYQYDLFDPSRNVWWVRQNWIPVETSSEEWYDLLMTQVRGGSDERPGVRLLDLDALQDKWYVASISGGSFDRRLALHDSVTGVPYFEDYGLDIFRGAAPVTDGFRLVRGTISEPGLGDQPVTEADLFVFNPRHVLLARSQKPAVDGVVSRPSPMPLTEWTSVRIDLAEATSLRAEVYNLIGQRVKVLRDESVPAGRHLLLWDGYWADGRPAESGMYLLRIVASGSEVTRKIVVLR